jgi:hypothetical protein
MTTDSSFFQESTEILITRKIIRIKGEVYQFSNVTGFSFQKLSPEMITIQKESTIPWLILLGGSTFYLSRASTFLSTSDIYTFLACLSIMISVMRIVQIEVAPSSRTKARYGLILILNSGSSIIFPSYNKREIVAVVDEIYSFMKEENDRELVSFQYNYDCSINIGEFSLDQSSSYYQYGRGDNIGRDKVGVK